MTNTADFRTMYDAVDAADVPSTGWDLLAGYVNGRYQSYVPLKKRFPHATVVSIDVLNHPGSAQVLDVEVGDATPAETPAWFDASLRAGVVRPTLYYSASLHDEVMRHMGRRRFDYWIAAYGVSKCPVAGAVAWQRTDRGPHGENVDISVVYDEHWPFPKEDDLTDAEHNALMAVAKGLPALAKRLDEVQAHIAQRFNKVDAEIAALKGGTTTTGTDA